jgi:MoaA/NifB/PqqE/SkfB family radical SAM enzyme
MSNKIFCNKPFNSIFLGPDGGIRPCCSLTGGDLGNLNNQSIEEILNGDLAKSIRQSFINNEWHSACNLCKTQEDIGEGLSERTYNPHNENHYDAIRNIGPSYFRLENTDLRWSNLCNLACNYCMPYFSSRWAQIDNIKVNSLQKESVSNLLKYIKNNLDNFHFIMMLGGEPLLQKENNELLDIISTAKNDIGITMVTNLSTPIENNTIAQKLMNHDGKVDWCISIETIGDRFEYVRDGANWEVLTKNIVILNNNRQNINLHPIYCVYSAFNLEEYFEWAISINANIITWQILFQPDPLSVLNLNKELRTEAIAEIDRVVEKYQTKFDMKLLQHIKNELLTFKEPLDLSTRIWHNDLEKNKLKNKKHTFDELWPELATKIG